MADVVADVGAVPVSDGEGGDSVPPGDDGFVVVAMVICRERCCCCRWCFENKCAFEWFGKRRKGERRQKENEIMTTTAIVSS